MSRVRRGGYISVTFIGDHAPRYVHAYGDGHLIVKWDLEGGQPMQGVATRRILVLIAELVAEGRL